MNHRTRRSPAAHAKKTLILFVIPARRFATAEWLVKPEPILILFQ
jgi:hypothetical protein